MSTFVAVLFPAGNSLTISWIIATLAIFAVFMVCYFRDFLSCRRAIKRALSVVREGTAQGAVIHYEDLKSKLTETLGLPWQEFEKTLVREDYGGQPEIVATVEAAYFINEASIVAPRMNQRLYNTVPGILTGLGILGTFVGLTWGLSQVNLGTNDVNSLRQDIEGLLSGMSVAFSSSLWGIALSLLFSLGEKSLGNRLNGDLDQLQMAIDTQFPHKNFETWLSESLWESRQQTAELKRFNTDLAISIAAALEEKLATRLTPALEELLAAIEKLSSTGSAEVGKTISEQAGGEMAKLGATLNLVQATLREIVEYSQDSQQDLARAMQSNLEQFTSSIGEALTTVNEKQQSFAGQLEMALGAIASRIEESLSKQQELLCNITSQTAEQLSSQVTKISEEMSGLLGALDGQAAAAAEEMRKQVLAVADYLKETATGLSESHANERHQMGALLDQVELMLVHLKDTMAQVEAAGNAFADSASPVTTAVSGLISANKEARESQQLLANLVRITDEQLARYTGSTKEILEQINRALKTTESSWLAYERKFGALRDDLESIFEELSKGLRDYNQLTGQGLGEFLRAVDEHVSKIAGLLSGAIEDLRGAVDELDDALARR